MGVRDRYLVGKLAPREAAERSSEFPVDPENADDDVGDQIVKSQTTKVHSPKCLAEENPMSRKKLMPPATNHWYQVVWE